MQKSIVCPFFSCSYYVNLELFLGIVIQLLLGLKCYNQEGTSAEVELDCDDIQGAKYCAKVTGPGVNAKTCAIEMIADAFGEIGLKSPTCISSSDYKFCLCEGNLCNK